MVQRYDYFAESEEFEPFDRGEWVKYEDYAKLEQRLRKVQGELERLARAYAMLVDGDK